MRFLSRLDELCLCVVIDFCNATDKKYLALASRETYQDVSKAALGVYVLEFRIESPAHPVNLPKSLGDIFRLVDRARANAESERYCVAFQYACASGYIQYIRNRIMTLSRRNLKILIDYKSSGGTTALQLSSANGYHEIAHMLCLLGVDLGGTEKAYDEGLRFASHMCLGATVYDLLQHRHFSPWTKLGECMTASIRSRGPSLESRVATLKILGQCLMECLSRNPSPSSQANDMGSFINNVHLLIQIFSIDELPQLLPAMLGDLGARPELVEGFRSFRFKNAFLNSPLPLATTKGHLEVIPLLLSSGLSSVDDPLLPIRKTSLYIACESGSLTMVKCLLQHKANVSCTTASGRNCLHAAIEKNHTEIVEMLCKHGCTVSDILQVNSTGFTPYWLAGNRGNMRIVTALLNAYRWNLLNRPHVDGNRPDEYLTKQLQKYASKKPPRRRPALSITTFLNTSPK